MRQRPRRPEQAERYQQVISMRRSRMTMDEIGKALGVSQQRASQIYARALKEIPAADLELHRREETVLIDNAVKNLLMIATNHRQPRTAVEAWRAILGWSERKARLRSVPDARGPGQPRRPRPPLSPRAGQGVMPA